MTRLLPVSTWKDLLRTKGPSITGQAFIFSQFLGARLFLVSERITNGDAETGGARSAEFNVIVDFVQMDLRPYKDAGRDINPYRRAELAEEVVAGDNIRATDKIAAHKWRIKMDTLRTDSSGKFGLGAFAQWRRINRIHIIKNGPEGLNTLE